MLNLAHGSMALYPAYVYAELRDSGDLVLPGVPGAIHLGEIGAIPSLMIAIAVAATVGLVAHAVVFGPLRRRGAPLLASVVATVGLHIVLEALVIMRFDVNPRLMPSVLPPHSLSVLGTRVPADRIYLALVVVAVAITATLVQDRTRFGLASRAMAEDEPATALLGYSPERLGAVNWMVGSALAGLFGILLAPMVGLSPRSYSFVVVPALATVVAGNFSSAGATVAVGLVLGVTQSQLTRLQLPVDWLGPQVLRELLPFVALAVFVAWRGALLPRREAARADRLPRADASRHPYRLLTALVVIGASAVIATDSSYRAAVIVSMIGALTCLSLVALTGFAGQISLAQLSFAGVSGFALSGLATDAAVPFPLAPLLAALGAGVCGVIVGIPALRARGMSFAVMTLGGALAVEELIFRNLSNGVLQSNTVPAARIAGLNLAATSPDGKPRAAFGLFVLAVLATAVAVVLALRRSNLGRRLLAVRGNERVAAASGVNVGVTKLVVFGFSAFIAGLAGALTGYHQGVVSAGSFTLAASFGVLAAAYLGGIGSVVGALVGGLIVAGGIVPLLLDRFLHIGRYETLLSGMAMVAVAVHNPEGIASAVRDRLPKRQR